MTPYQAIGDIGELLVDLSYYLLIFLAMTVKSHVVEHLHHNLNFDEILDLPRGKDHMLNILAKQGGIIPTRFSCGYDANWDILCKDQDRVSYYSNHMDNR